MRSLTRLTVTAAILALASIASAQRPGGGPGPGPPPGGPGRADDLVARMMAFDKDQDGKIARSEVTDERLRRLFERADANQDGTVTKDELTALADREAANDRGGPRGGGPPGFPPGGMARPGEVLPAGIQTRLGLSAEQRTELADLQKDVDARLEKILSDDQRKQLREMRERGPGRGGFGPPTGPGGDRPPGGRGRPGGDRPPPPPPPPPPDQP